MVVSDNLVGKQIKGYVLTNLLGKGSFGVIYEARNQETNELVAIKTENRASRYQQLCYENRILRYLDSSEGFPCSKFYHSSSEYNFMGMDKLGSSLEDLLTARNRKFSVKTICMIGVVLISRLEVLHSKGLLHRDIKPDNFLIGLPGNEKELYMIDFGLSKRFKEPKTGVHIPYRDDKALTGTARYASVNAHKGIEQSRRDDIESLGYVLVYFARGGKLPWQGMKHDRRSKKYEMIMDKKARTPIHALCRNLPKCFSNYLEYARTLRFESRPNYDWLKWLFLEHLEQEYEGMDFEYDWLKPQQSDSPESEMKPTEKVKPKRCC